MTNREFNNFTEANTVAIVPHKHQDIGQLISIVQYGGSLSFNFSMYPLEARKLAMHILTCVDNIEKE